MAQMGFQSLILLGWRGTLWLGQEPLPGARELIRRLRTHGASFLIVTNDTALGSGGHAEAAEEAGFELEAADVLTVSSIALTQIKVRYPGAPVLVVGTEMLEAECRRAGLRLMGDVETSDREPVILLGRCPHLDSDRVFEAIRRVRRGAPFYATHLDQVHPIAGGIEPDCGALVAMIQAATGRTPVVFGKPDPRVVDHALGITGFCSRKEVVIVGARGSSDLEMARRAGIAGISIGGDGRPDGHRVVEDLLSLPALLESDRDHEGALAESWHRMAEPHERYY